MYNRDYVKQYGIMQDYIYTATNKCQYDPYLMHYGVKGMKWYQHLMAKFNGAVGRKTSGSVANTKTGKRLTSRSKSFAGRVQRRMQIQQAKKIKKNQKTSNTLSKDKRKAQILKSRSAKELYKNADLFTTEELNAAYQRLALEKRISELEPQSQSTVDKWIDRTSKTVKLASNAASITTQGINLYNNMASTYNSLQGGNMKLINTKGQKDKDKDKDDD